MPSLTSTNLQKEPVLLSCLLCFKKGIFVCLTYLYREFHYDIPMYIVLWPELVHPLHFSPFYLSSLLMVISTGLNILYLFLYRKYINHIHLLYFLPLPFPFTVLKKGCNKSLNLAPSGCLILVHDVMLAPDILQYLSFAMKSSPISVPLRWDSPFSHLCICSNYHIV
jgi:hypothetical protein